MKPVAIFRHTRTEGPAYFATYLDRRNLPYRMVRIDEGEAVPDSAGDCAGLCFMGGPMSVNDDLPWIAQVCDLIRDAVARDVPVLGHCLGGQLMAKALGAKVTRNPVKEIGWGEVRVADNAVARQWFGDAKDFPAFHWHGETFSLPEKAVLLFSSPYCKHQAFAVGIHLAMQCHVEVTEEMVHSWSTYNAAEIAQNLSSPAVQTAPVMQDKLPQRITALNAVANRLYTQWIQALKR